MPAVDVPVAALPVPYRTHAAEPSFQSLRDPQRPGFRPFPVALDPFTCTRDEIADFTRAARDLAREAETEMPIVDRVYAVLFEGEPPQEAIRALMTREPKSEYPGTQRAGGVL